jgi:crotonobetainyl-CoA:carnitine CoA-transferase CaiB-like acyl-CoA transferase
MEAFIANDIGADPFLTPDEFLAHPQMTDNGRVVAVTDADGTTTQVGALASFATTPSTIRRGAPRVGEHGTVMFPPAPARDERGTPDHPLSGVTLVEMAYFIAGPLAGALLAEMGARVIKVEPPGGDPFRRLGLQSAKVVHGKESIVLDLKARGARDVVDDLVAAADVFVHTFRPGVADRLGIDAATLLARNPRLVYVHGTSYGSRGPWAGRPAFHSTPSALAGSGILQAGEGNPPVDDSYPDPCSALGVATAVLLGLHARQRNGTGQVVETTMLTTTGYAMSPFLVRYPGAPPWRLPDPGQHGTSARHRLYRCQEGWAFVGCVTDDDWDAVASTLGLPPDPGAGDDAAAARAVAEVLRTAPADSWQRHALASGAPIVAVSDVPKEAWLEDEKLLIEASHPAFGDYWRPPVRVGFERLPSRLGPAAAAGEHTRAILTELGRSPSEIDALLASGAAIEWTPTSKGAPQ